MAVVLQPVYMGLTSCDAKSDFLLHWFYSDLCLHLCASNPAIYFVLEVIINCVSLAPLDWYVGDVFCVLLDVCSGLTRQNSRGDVDISSASIYN